MNTEGLEMLKHRRSVRKFQTKQIETEILNQILEAGTYAPTANGKQQPVIVAVQMQITVMKLTPLMQNSERDRNILIMGHQQLSLYCPILKQ